MNLSGNGIRFLKQREGFRATVYKDLNGYDTIGFGHKVKPGETFGAISSVEATALLYRDAQDAVNCINMNVHPSLNQNQFDALCSFVYNIGCDRFKESQVLYALNRKDFEGAAEAFKNWHRPNLMNRRLAEIELFKGEYSAVEEG